MTAVQKLMSCLHCTEEEALQIIADDKRIDRGEKLFELTDEQKQASKKARQAQRVPTVIKFTQRERKAKPEKADLCSAMMEGLKSLPIADLKVANPEREFSFTLDGVAYKVVLSCPRK